MPAKALSMQDYAILNNISFPAKAQDPVLFSNNLLYSSFTTLPNVTWFFPQNQVIFISLSLYQQKLRSQGWL